MFQLIAWSDAERASQVQSASANTRARALLILATLHGAIDPLLARKQIQKACKLQPDNAVIARQAEVLKREMGIGDKPADAATEAEQHGIGGLIEISVRPQLMCYNQES